MIKEYIEVLDNLRPEETRFDFDPLNKNLCFGGSGGGGNPLANLRDNLLSGFGFTGGGGGGGGSTTESGGLSEEDKKMKQMFYEEIKELFGTEYTPYQGDRYADKSQGEKDLLSKLKGGGGYSSLYDTARENLGFTSGVYKDAAGYDVGDLDADARRLMDEGSTYRDTVADTTMRQMNEAASMSGMINRGREIGGGTAWSDRSGLQDMWGKQNYLSAAGDQLGRMNMSAYSNALDRARGLNVDRQTSAGLYGRTVLDDLGLGTGGLDKTYATSLGAFGQDRAYQDRDLAFDKKMWDEEQNYPFKKLAYSSGLYSGMPFEEKVITQQPGSSGK